MENLLKIIKVSGIDLDVFLKHMPENSWIDGRVAPSRINGNHYKDIRDSSMNFLNEELEDLIENLTFKYVYEYAEKNNISISNKDYQVARYSPGQFFKEHVDATIEFPRKISTLLYLNDNYEGGTITFTKLNVSIKPEKNTMLIFPSNEDFAHSADPVISGTKYVVVGFWS